jgi:hypothetical protein
LGLLNSISNATNDKPYIFLEQQKQLERTREMSQAEREKLLDLVQTLESKLNSIEQVSSAIKQFSIFCFFYLILSILEGGRRTMELETTDLNI